jgi:hypothetical protein
LHPSRPCILGVCLVHVLTFGECKDGIKAEEGTRIGSNSRDSSLEFDCKWVEASPLRNEIEYESDPADPAHFIDYVYDDETVKPVSAQKGRSEQRPAVS